MSSYHHGEKHIYSRNGNIYYYWTLGNKQKSPILLLPGFTGTHSDLLQLAHYISHDFYIIIPDLPGWGISPPLKGKQTLTHYARYLNDILNDLGIRKIYIFGHCMGTILVLEFALQFPERIREIFLVSIPYDEGTLHKAIFLHLANFTSHVPYGLRPLLFLWRNRFTSFLLSFFILKFRTFHKITRVTVRNFLNQRKQVEDVVEDNWISFIYFDYQRVKKIRKKIHIIHGIKDVLIKPEQAKKFCELVPLCTFDTLPNAGHLPPVESPKTLANYILRYTN